MSWTARSPMAPPPWNQASPSVFALFPWFELVPCVTEQTARSGRAMPWSFGSGNMRSA